MRLTGVCEIVGCLMLGLGIAPRIAAVAFALFTVLVSLLFLRFWTSRPDAPDFLLRRNTFFSNLAMIGGLIGVTMHYLRFGPKQVKEDREGPQS